MSFNEEKNKAVESAKRLIAQLKIKDGPIDVEAVARHLGIEVRMMELPDDISGLIKRKGKDGQPVIAVNEEQAETRQRFTIAHEIGHFLLHALDPVHVDAAQVYFRGLKTPGGFDMREAQANAFAAELLMPSGILMNELKEGVSMDGSSDLVPGLAKKYQVSDQAMAIRIGTLLQGV